MRRRVAVFDLDGTITRNDTYVAFLLQVLRRRPARLLRAAWLPAAVGLHKLGLRDNTWLKRVFLGAIAAGLDAPALEAVTRPFVRRVLDREIRPGARAALHRHADQGDTVLLASASFDFYVRTLAAELGIAHVVCTRSSWVAGRLAGAIDGENCYGAAKLRRVSEWLGAGREGCHVIAYSDHRSDIPLLDWADEAIAVNPDERLLAHCKDKGYAIVDWASADGPLKEQAP